jgi:hypothetical protein
VTPLARHDRADALSNGPDLSLLARKGKRMSLLGLASDLQWVGRCSCPSRNRSPPP